MLDAVTRGARYFFLIRHARDAMRHAQRRRERILMRYARYGASALPLEQRAMLCCVAATC